MALADVEVAEPGAAVLDRLADEALLDVHVVGVEMREGVGGADAIEECHDLGTGVDDVGLVAVDDLDADRDVRGLSLLADAAHHLDHVGDALLGLGLQVLLQGGVDHAAEVARPQVAHHGDRGVEQVLAPLHRVGVLARDVGRGREAEGRGGSQLVLVEAGARELGRKAVRVEQRDLDVVVAELGGAA